MTDNPVALDAYESLAEAYAAAIDTKPHNAYYERPTTLSLLPKVKGKRVLDAGCGPGVYSEWLIERGAEVVAVDASPKMVELAKQRLGTASDVRQADLSKPLTFLGSSSFDMVLSPLVLEYVEDWGSTFAEFYRVLRPDGHLVFSVTHPFFDYIYFKSNNYFETELVGSEWSGFKPIQVYVPSFRRSLGATLNPLVEAGFCLEKILEPKPTDDFKKADPKHYEELSQQPCFLCIRARK
ncbi:MAG: class I SAM-dependent methyltransferase [Acidobacteriota bacterium]|nr:class I SAM-dependent methyltransferase [Acidobacteriota bacterium]MDQ3652935.1 class I SAM-dependent methyltransferase [Acidobacteriota bacterium]